MNNWILIPETYQPDTLDSRLESGLKYAKYYHESEVNLLKAELETEKIKATRNEDTAVLAVKCARAFESRIMDVIAYCKPYLEHMWAAQVVGTLLGCEYRDAKQELKRYEEFNAKK